ncbi:hypothetical protein EAI89_02905 [Eubacterium sp. am_0171]|nr:hypothetical protein EAI89_02905 [Eubacterium sp. am_0171]
MHNKTNTHFGKKNCSMRNRDCTLNFAYIGSSGSRCGCSLLFQLLLYTSSYFRFISSVICFSTSTCLF